MDKDCGGETCKVCKMKDCYIRGLKDFREANAGETDTFLLEMEVATIAISRKICKMMGVSIIPVGLILDIRFTLLCGYFKGRTYQDVPDVFKQV